MNNALSTFLLVAAAGAGLVLQNALMIRMATGGPLLAALLANSLVGLVLIASAGACLHGPSFAAETLLRFRPFWLLPGVLGTYFVFASVTGYRNFGAAPTIAILVASQLCCGLLADALAVFGPGRGVSPAQWLGAAFLVAGAFLSAPPRP